MGEKSMFDLISKVGAKVGAKLHSGAIRGFASAFPAFRFDTIGNELIRVAALPRHKEFDTRVNGVRLHAVDSAAYVAMYHEIFGEQIYRFKTATASPYVLDCGANIGMSVMYFKHIYPAARIVAFEPDPRIFALLEGNLREAGLSDVTLVPKGVWNADGALRFVGDPELGVGGHIASDAKNSDLTFEIPVTRLRSYITDRVDFLKLDVEGAECEVIADCADLLTRVQNIFIEYHSFANRPQCLARLLLALADAGFRVHMHCIGARSHSPFVGIDCMSNGMDMQLNIFGVRMD
jgi:FkbM family methyltransferase